MTGLFEVDALIALVTLTALEIVLGIDNIIFISILASRLPVEQQARARTLGLGVAMVTRVLLLLSLTWVMKLTAPLFAVLGHTVSGRDLILIGGGLFLLAKSTLEIHHKLEGDDESHSAAKAVASFTGVIGGWSPASTPRERVSIFPPSSSQRACSPHSESRACACTSETKSKPRG